MTRAEAINHLKQDGDPKGNIIMLWWNKESFSHHDIRAKAKGVYSE